MPKRVTRIEQPKAAYRKLVAAYCRVSTDHEAQLDSLENQMETFRFRAAQRGDWDLVNIYADEGLSGTSLKGRLQFQQDRKSTRLNSSHPTTSRMPSAA